MKVYLVNEKNYEYNDEQYYPTEGDNTCSCHLKKEGAIIDAIRRNRRFFIENDIIEYILDYSDKGGGLFSDKGLILFKKYNIINEGDLEDFCNKVQILIANLSDESLKDIFEECYITPYSIMEMEVDE